MEEKDIGAIIREARKKKHYTQAQLAILLGYTNRSGEVMVQGWERGRELIPITKIRKLSEVLEIPLDDLIP